MTFDELIAQCKADNPTMKQTVNNETFILSAEEYEQAVKDWASMRLEQIEHENNPKPPKPMVVNEAEVK